MIKYKNIVSIVGRTNVGKSTLFNILNNKKISIITQKKNTTIRCVENTYNQQDNAIKLIDTPGPIIKNTNLKYNINKLIYDTIKISNILIVVIDQTSLKSEDFFILELIKKYKKPKFLIINKIDKINNKNILLSFINKIKNITSFTNIIPISNKQKININELNTEIKKLIPKNKTLENNKHFKESEDNLIKDIVRETLLKSLNKELPYIIKVDIENQTNHKFTKTLNLKLIIKKNTHKKIIIGHNGCRIQHIIQNIKKELININKKMKNTIIKINIQHKL